MRVRFSRIASALRPVCGTLLLVGSELATLDGFRLSTLSGLPCAAAGTSISAVVTATTAITALVHGAFFNRRATTRKSARFVEVSTNEEARVPAGSQKSIEGIRARSLECRPAIDYH